MNFYTFFPSPIGVLTLESDGQALTALRIAGTASDHTDFLPLWEPITQWLTRYFAGRDPGPFPVPLAPRGTPFQIQVWELLQEISWGETTSYGELARQLEAKMGIPKMSAQAVGGAVGRNPIPIVIPCHRVLGAKGQLTGFSCGLPVKIALLTLEGIPISTQKIR